MINPKINFHATDIHARGIEANTPQRALTI